MHYHSLGIVTEGHILGLEEAVLSQAYVNYGCTVEALVDSELFRIEKLSFINKLSSQTQAWNAIYTKSENWMKRGH
jgi:CRP-like cAMP-binding protein